VGITSGERVFQIIPVNHSIFGRVPNLSREANRLQYVTADFTIPFTTLKLVAKIKYINKHSENHEDVVKKARFESLLFDSQAIV
jgi:hypothetical protein